MMADIKKYVNDEMEGKRGRKRPWQTLLG